MLCLLGTAVPGTQELLEIDHLCFLGSLIFAFSPQWDIPQWEIPGARGLGLAGMFVEMQS